MIEKTWVDMAFNLGMGGLATFEKFLAAMADGHYTEAAEHMLDSKWATQVGARATELAAIIRTGEYQQ